MNIAPAPERNFRNKYWVLLLALWWIVSVSIAMSGINSVSVDLPELLGRVVGATLVSWLIFYFVIARGAGKPAPVVSLVALLAAAAIGSFLGLSRNRGQALQSVEGFKREVAALSDTSAGATQLAATPAHTAASASGNDLSTIIEYDKVILRKVMAINEDYSSDLDRIGWGTILKADRLAKDKDLHATRQILSMARTSLLRHKAAYDELVSNVVHDVNAMNISDNTKAEFITGFKGASASNTLWGFESRTLDAFDAIADHLASTQWTISQNKLKFNRDADLNEYLSRLARVRAISDSENVVTTKAKENVKSALSTTEKSLK